MEITNHWITGIKDKEVSFSLKDYRDEGRQKIIKLSGEEFLRNFYLHILPRGFVKIRHYSIYSLRFLNAIIKKGSRMIVKTVETTAECINRLIGQNILCCPSCRIGRLIPVRVIPRSRSPTLNHLYPGL